MLRTVVSFEPAEKAWLDQEAKIERVSMTKIVRKALELYRSSVELQKKPAFSQLLKETAGTYKCVDGLKFQHQLREEWDK